MTVDRTIGRSIGQNCPKRQIMFLKTHKGINVSVLMKNFLVFLSDCLNDQAIWLQLGTLKGAQIRADSRKHFKRCVSISRLLSRLSFLWSNDRPFNNAKTYHFFIKNLWKSPFLCYVRFINVDSSTPNFRQEIRQSHYRNDPVKYDLVWANNL